MLALSEDDHPDVIEAFNSTSGHLDDLLNCYTQSRAPGCTTSCAASDGGGGLPVNSTTVRQFTIKTPTTLEFEYSVFIYKIYSQTTHFT